MKKLKIFILAAFVFVCLIYLKERKVSHICQFHSFILTKPGNIMRRACGIKYSFAGTHLSESSYLTALIEGSYFLKERFPSILAANRAISDF